MLPQKISHYTLISMLTALAGCGAGSETRDEALSRGEAPVVEPVFDENGEPWIGQAAPDHEIREDGSVVISDRPLTLLVVFDTSSSMRAMWDSRSRWSAAYESVLGAVTEFQETITVGAIVFPSDGGCGVLPIEHKRQFDFMRGPDFLSAWQQRLGGPSGTTPLHLALLYADEAIARATELGLLDNRFRVLLFSDGEPTCSDDAAALAHYPARWLEHGIHTYVVALPGSAPAAALLDSMAIAGGTGVDQGGGAAILVDPAAREVYDEGVAEEGASRVVVDDEEDLDDVAHAAAR